MTMKYPRALTIAGSDSGGGAGIQADLKTFSALGVYGMSAITSVTAQNTQEVRGVRDLPLDIIASQMEAVLDDIGVDAVKTGMLSTAEIVGVVAETLQHYKIKNLIVDPVMISKSGAVLLQENAQQALKEELLPLALLLTPNIPEAEALGGCSIKSDADIQHAAKIILGTGVQNLLIKGGHRPGDTVEDWLFLDGKQIKLSAPRVNTKNTHGTGCTFSAAICAGIAKGFELEDAVQQAKEYLSGAIQHADALNIGGGHGPLNHHWNQK